MLNLENLEGLQFQLGKRLSLCGLDLDEFSKQIRDFFAASLLHFDRTSYRDALAECLGLDMNREKDRDKLWETIAKSEGIARKVRTQWLTGEIDPPPIVLRRHLFQLSCPNIKARFERFFDVEMPVQTAIIRTLIYIRVFPPQVLHERECLDGKPKDLQDCWDLLRRHVHYRTPPKDPRKELNQHAIDYLRKEIGEKIWIEPKDLGCIMQAVEQDLQESHAFYWTYIYFKFSTFVDIKSTNKIKKNPYGWIWDELHPNFKGIWGI